MGRSVMFGVRAAGFLLGAAVASCPALAVVSHLNGNAVAGNQQGVSQSYTNVLDATLTGLVQRDDHGNDALTAGSISIPGGVFGLSSHACSGGFASMNVGSASAAGNAGADLTCLLTSSTLPPGTPVQVQVNWGIAGRVTTIGAGFMNVQDVSQASLMGQVALQINTTTIFNRTGGYSRGVTLFGGTQVIHSGNLNVLGDGDSQVVTVLVGQSVRLIVDASIGAGTFAFGPAVANADVQCSMTWGMTALSPDCQLVLMETPPIAMPPASNGTIEHARDIIPPRPDGTYPCITFFTQPESDIACDGNGQFAVSAIGTGTLHYVWETEVAPGMWIALGNDPRPIQCPGGGNGFAFATPIDSASVTIGVRGCPGPYSVRCIVTDDCGTGTSNAATLTICAADFNCDDVANSQDFFDFLGAFFQAAADFNHDGATNSQDFFDFLAALFLGC